MAELVRLGKDKFDFSPVTLVYEDPTPRDEEGLKMESDIESDDNDATTRREYRTSKKSKSGAQ